MSNTSTVRDIQGGIVFSARIRPGAKRSGFAGLHGGSVKIDVGAPPVDGKANKELIRFLSEALSVPKSAVEIVRGDKTKDKTVKISGLSSSKLLAAIRA